MMDAMTPEKDFYVRVQPRTVPLARRWQVDVGVLLDLDKSGGLIGVEVRDGQSVSIDGRDLDVTAGERVVALEAENAALRDEVGHWRGAHRQERHGEWPVGIEQPHPVGARPRAKPLEVFDTPTSWPVGSTIQPAPLPRGLCERCAAAVARGETAVCGCVTSGPVIC